jgi:hypothetical protein
LAGTIIADFIRTDANQLSLNVGNTTFATINASGFFSNTGTQIIAANGRINAASIASGSIPGSALSTAANTIPRSSMTSGAVLQVVYASTSSQISAANNTETDILSASITPISTANKILVLGTIMGTYKSMNSGSSRMKFRIVRGASTAINDADANLYFPGASNQDFRHGGFAISIYDNPATTSSQSYKLTFVPIDSNTSYVNKDSNGGTTTLVLMEIAA